jgi:hypothetical protein
MGPGLETGAITGTVAACPGVGLLGSLVFVPGRSFSGYTGPDGRFTLSYVPAGAYDLVVALPGRLPQTFTGATVAAGQATDVGALAAQDLSADPFNCGSCGTVCASGVCETGVCRADCHGTMCGGVCIDTHSDPSNCGGCGRVCGAGLGCSRGSCIP